MSLPNDDRNFRPANGKNFPAATFTAAAADALHREYNQSRTARSCGPGCDAGRDI